MLMNWPQKKSRSAAASPFPGDWKCAARRLQADGEVVHLREGIRNDPVIGPATFATIGDQSSVSEYPEVEGQSGLCCFQLVLELAHAQLPAP